MCAVCRFVGLTVEQCADAALNFKGAGRRFEVYGECNGALVVDDYAHHPTELRATLNTAKEMGYKRLIAVHQPFTYSRTKMLFNDFVDVLKIPDITVLTPIMGSREPNDPTITSAKLAAQIPGSVLVNSLEEAAEWVKQTPGGRSGHHPRLRRHLQGQQDDGGRQPVKNLLYKKRNDSCRSSFSLIRVSSASTFPRRWPTRTSAHKAHPSGR